MSERLAFIQACLNRNDRIVDVCARFGISEKTGQKFLHRFRVAGLEGLVDRSRARRAQARRTPADIATRILVLRRQHPLYGPAKLRDWLLQHEPTTAWPAASTIGELLKRAGLVPGRRARQQARQHARLENAHTAATAPNVVWTVDFKGQFPLTAGVYCYPLTVLDLHSHFLLRCTALPSTAVSPVRHQFLRLFREYGLPTVIRSDNGVPFAQPNALGRLGALGFWWVRLGIRPEHTRPAHPAENGAHERFHKTLKAHTARPPATSFSTQQRRFDRFRAEYNTERPHAATTDHCPPTRQYVASLRAYPSRLPPLDYPDAIALRRVDPNGSIKWHSHPIFLSHNLAGQDVGLTEAPGDVLTIYYAALILGDYDLHTRRFLPNVRWTSDSTTPESSIP